MPAIVPTTKTSVYFATVRPNAYRGPTTMPVARIHNQEPSERTVVVRSLYFQKNCNKTSTPHLLVVIPIPSFVSLQTVCAKQVRARFLPISPVACARVRGRLRTRASFPGRAEGNV